MDSGPHANMKRNLLNGGTHILRVISRAGRSCHLISRIFSLLLLFIQPVNLNLWIVISFLAFSLYYEWKQRRYVFLRFLLERYYGSKMELQALKPIHVKEEESVLFVLEQFQRGQKHLIVIEKEDNETSQLDENELLHAYFSEKRLSAKIGELLYPY